MKTEMNEQAISKISHQYSLCIAYCSIVIVAAAACGFWASTAPSGLDLVPTKPLHLLAFGAALLGSVFLYRKPEVGLLLFVPLVYSNASEIAVRHHGMPSVLQALGILLGLVILGRCLLQRERFRTDAILIFSAVYGVVLFGSSVYATNPQLADEKLLEYLRCLLVLTVVMNLARSRMTLQRAVWTLVIVGAVLSTISAFQVMTASYECDFGGFGRIKDAQIVGDLRQPRIAGAFADPNFYAQVLIPLVPLAIYRILDEASRRRKLIAIYALIACLTALVFTYSRGGILALGVELGLILMIERVRLKHCLAGIALLAVALALVPANLEQRLGTLNQFVSEDDSLFVDTDSSFQQRSLLMRVAWDIWRDHPLAGVGAGNYSEYYQEYADRIGATVSSYENFNQQRFAHSLYLEIAAETGLVGLSIFTAILIAVAMKGWRAIRILRRSGDIKTARLITSLMVGSVGYLTTSLFLHSHYPRHLYLLLALIAASVQVANYAAAGHRSGAKI